MWGFALNFIWTKEREQKRDPSIIESFLVLMAGSFYLQSDFFLLVVFTLVAPFLELILDLADWRWSVFPMLSFYSLRSKKERISWRVPHLKIQGQFLLVSS